MANTIGYIAVNTTKEMEDEVYAKIKRIGGITEVHNLYGDYDLLARIEAENFDKVKDIADKIGALEYVVKTKVMRGSKF